MQPQNFGAAELPRKVASGEELEVQICPYGEYEKSGVVQKCDSAAFQHILNSFDGQREVLVDFDHDAESGGSTRAAAWLTALREDPERGLMGTLRFTGTGAEAVSAREYRYLSPCWEVGEDGRPQHLLSIGLTNRPNIPVACLLNRAPETVTDTVEQGTRLNMEKIIEALGLEPGATEDDILAAIGALKAQLSELTDKVRESEAEEAITEAGGEEVIANRAAWVSAWKRDPEGVKVLLNALSARKAPAKEPAAPAKAPLCNSKDAQPPKLSFADQIRGLSAEATLEAIRKSL